MCSVDVLAGIGKSFKWFHWFVPSVLDSPDSLVKYVDVPLNDKVVRDMLVKADMNMTLESTINATIDGDFTVKKILWIKNLKKTKIIVIYGCKFPLRFNEIGADAQIPAI